MSVSLSYFDAMLCREFEGVGFCFHLLPGCVLPVLCGRWGAVGGCGRRWAWVRCCQILHYKEMPNITMFAC